jgi:hypothetical protein
MDYAGSDNGSDDGSGDVPRTSAAHTWIEGGTLASQHGDSRMRKCTVPLVVSV